MSRVYVKRDDGRVERVDLMKAKPPRFCLWENDSEGFWRTSCGAAITLTNDDGLKANDINYCSKCGKKIKESK